MSGEPSDSVNTLRETSSRADASPAEPKKRSTGGFKRSVEPQTVEVGVPRRNVRSSLLFNYDRGQGAKDAGTDIDVDPGDRMPARLAKEKLLAIHGAYGMLNQDEGKRYEFDRGLLICLGMNSTSRLAEIAKLEFFANSTWYSMRSAAEMLGEEIRRFARGFANEIVDLLRWLYEFGADPNNAVLYELRARLIQLAQKRNCGRYVWLATDVADAATNLSAAELTVAIASKLSAIAATTNAVDSRDLNPVIMSADRYDSTTNTTVPVGGGSTGRGKYFS